MNMHLPQTEEARAEAGEVSVFALQVPFRESQVPFRECRVSFREFLVSFRERYVSFRLLVTARDSERSESSSRRQGKGENPVSAQVVLPVLGC